MVALAKPLPPPQLPIAGQFAPNQPYAEWFFALDKCVRAMLAPLPNVQTANYILSLDDAFGTVEMNLAGANTLTVPLNNAVPFPIGTRIVVTQAGAGATTITPAVGVTVRSRPGLVTNGQWAVAQLYKRGADEWVASGDLV